jgi:hypothetical protein
MTQDRTPNQHALPNFQNAIISREKLEMYCLDPQHVSRPYGKSSGKDKARVFKAALGFEQDDWELFKRKILEALPYYEATLRNEDIYGKRYNVELSITGPNVNTVTVLTAWIVRPGTDYPFFVTTLCLEGN